MSSKRTIVELIDIYVEAVQAGASRKEIEDRLLNEGVHLHDLREVKRSIERLGLLEEHPNEPFFLQRAFRAKAQIWIGRIVALFGIVSFAASYYYGILSIDLIYDVVTVIGGLVITIRGRNKLKRILSDQSDPSRIRTIHKSRTTRK